MPISKLSQRLAASAVLFAAPLMAGAAAASEVAGRPEPGGTGLQRAVTVVARDIHWMDNFLLWIIGGICLLVLALLVIVILRFNHRANPKPARFTHNTVLEVVWTAIPALILVIIAIPSLRLLFFELDIPEADVTIKATGNQWYWSYEYPDQGVSFDAFMIGQGQPGLTEEVRAELEAAGYTPDLFRLATDERVVVPKGANVHVIVTGADVIHAWAVPSFGVKIDAVPGRLNETWFNAEETGLFFGQCSELCGKDHAYMPIVVEVVEPEAFEQWVAQKQAEGASRTRVAAAELAR